MSRSLSFLRTFSSVLDLRCVNPSVSVVRWRHSKTREIRATVKARKVERIEEKQLPFSRDEQRQMEKQQLDGVDKELVEDYQDLLMNTDKVYDQVAEEERRREIQIRNILIKKSLDPIPLESNLLYWAAKQQIKYLHRRDPAEWTPEKIAEEFPISVEGAKRLLRNNSRIQEEKIAAHDAEVDLRWRLLHRIRKTGKCPAKAEVSLQKKTIELYLENKLQHEDLKAGNPDFPKPSSIAGIRIPVKVGTEGEHFNVLQDYRHLLSSGEKDAEKDKAERILVSNPGDVPRTRSEKLARILDKSRKTEQMAEDDPEGATRLDLPENFIMPFVHEFTGQSDIRFEDMKKLMSHEDPPALEGATKAKKPRKNKFFKLGNSNESQEHPNKYKQVLPTGKVDEWNTEEGTYRIGRTVYDADGSPLYRIP